MSIILYRTEHKTHCSGRWVFPDASEIYTLERPWLNNQQNVSCIPYGTYKVYRDKTGKHQWWRISEVDGRTHIEIHPANYVDQLLGCVAPSMKPTTDGRAYASTAACQKILDWFGDDNFSLRILKDA